jgi:hypothetical protein
MAPRITGSRNRSTRKRTKNPTSSQNRSQRSRASTNSQRITRGDSVSRYKPLQGRGALRTTQSGFTSMFGKGKPVTTGGMGVRGGGTGLLVEGLLRLGGAVLGNQKDRKQQRKDSQDNLSAPATAMRKQLQSVQMPEYVKPERPKKRQELSSGAKDFDRAFRKAYDQGLSEFTWRGNRYSTEMA